MGVWEDNLKYINGGYVGGRQRYGLHPQLRQKFIDFITDARNGGIKVQIFSGHRSFEHQQQLYLAWYNNGKKNGNGGRRASKPGHGIHELGMAIDLRVFNDKLGKYDVLSSIPILRELYKKYAVKHGLRWGGNFSSAWGNEQHHFDFVGNLGITGVQARSRAGKYIEGFEKQKYIILDDQEIPKSTSSNVSWTTGLGDEPNSFEEYEYEPIKRKPPKPINKVEDRNAVGIWQIIKLMADRYALDQSINDATIAFNQGSLKNFVDKIIQEPWLEFWGDTYGDQYYFNARKERFDYSGFTLTAKFNWTIEENDVIADDLNWYNGPIYSWYQIIPQGSFLGEQNQIFAHVTAVFFEEYAEVWGSKPLSVVNNYINFVKNADGPIMYEKALTDLRYMVESNAYLPFTREGTITVRPMPGIRRGYWIFYKPTMEMFYVDGVNHRYVVTDGSTELVTTLKVIRGMDYRHLIAPKSKTTKSYWNLILFDDPPPVTKYKDEKVSERWYKFFFDNDRSYPINLQETWPPSADTRDKKMENQIKEFPNLRNELKKINDDSVNSVVGIIEENPDAPEFIFKGFIDADFGSNDNTLPLGRARTFKNLVLDEYMRRHPTDSREKLESKMRLTAGNTDSAGDERINWNAESKKNLNDPSQEKYKEKAYARFAKFTMPEYNKKVPYEEEVRGVNWKVNDEVFQYFLNRKQKHKCS